MGNKLEQAFETNPVVAIIRGAIPDEIVDIGEALFEAGVRIVEVPLNSPQPFRSIALLNDVLGKKMVVGAGTVLTIDDVKKVAAAGGEICVAPNTNKDVIHASLINGMIPMPGYQTLTEAFTAIDVGATWLKCFPSGTIGPSAIKSHRDVIPSNIKIIAVGGVSVANATAFLDAGCDGVGLAGSLYVPGKSAIQVGEMAMAMTTELGNYVAGNRS